jgi:hypothetical protein
MAVRTVTQSSGDKTRITDLQHLLGHFCCGRYYYSALSLCAGISNEYNFSQLHFRNTGGIIFAKSICKHFLFN